MYAVGSHFLRLATCIAICASVLAGCGGGSGGGDGSLNSTSSSLKPFGPVDVASATSAVQQSGRGGGVSGRDGGVSGGAGDGAPLKGAVVTLIDALGHQETGLTDDKGNFIVLFDTATFKPPFVLRVVDAGGNVLSSVSNETVATGKVIRVNINPLTDKITSDVLSSTVVGTDKTFDGSKVDVSKLAQATADLVTSVKDALTKAGVTDTANFDPVRSAYAYEGTGVDAVIESISHARDPVSGATQLRAKLVGVANNADGTVVTTLISAATPLATTLVATPDNPALTYSKLNNWLTEINRCLALDKTSADLDPVCNGNSTNVLRSTNYLHNSMDLQEHLQTLFSDANREAILGSSLRNPTLLFTGRYASSSTYDDLAVVEVTIRQPRTGVLAGSVSSAVEYTQTLVFKRDDTLTQSKAGNWILNGNQRSYNLSVSTRYKLEGEVNTLKSGNAPGYRPDNLQSRLNFNVNKYRYNIPTHTWVDAGIRAVRVTGPALPTTGVVLVPSSAAGQNTLAIYNQTDVVPTSPTSTGGTNNSFGLAAIQRDGNAVYPNFFRDDSTSNNLQSMLTDFSTLQAYTRYKFEIFLNSSSSTTAADATEYSYNLAPVFTPAAMLSAPINSIAPSKPLVDASAGTTLLGGSSITVSWTNNLNAAPVNKVQVFTQQYINSVFTTVNQVTNVASAYSINQPATSQLVTAPSGSSFATLTKGTLGDYRHIGIWSSQGRAEIQSLLRWDNN